MFSIYGTSGPIFTGTLEKLNQINPLARASPVRAIAANEDELVVSPANNQHRDEAVRAYRSMLPRDLERGPLYHADQIMQREVITVSAGDEAARAWRNLHSHHIHQAPVLDDDARLVGIVSERDLLMAINIEADQIVDSLGRYVRDVMTTPVVAAAPVTDIRRIAKVMLDRQVDGVPIVNEYGLLVGFVSRSEILRAVVVDPPLSLWR